MRRLPDDSGENSPLAGISAAQHKHQEIAVSRQVNGAASVAKWLSAAASVELTDARQEPPAPTQRALHDRFDPRAFLSDEDSGDEADNSGENERSLDSSTVSTTDYKEPLLDLTRVARVITDQQPRKICQHMCTSVRSIPPKKDQFE